MKLIRLTVFLCAVLLFSIELNASISDVLVQERKQFGKPIRTKMPPQLIIDTLQKQLDAVSPGWQTFWQNFVVEDDELKDEYLIIGRSVEKRWAFGVLDEDCPKPENFEQLKSEVRSGGTPVRMDLLIGIKKKRAWFRYVVNVYEPVYPYWKNPCYVWNLPPELSKDKFYNENYTMKVYSENLRKKVYLLVSELSGWKPPKQVEKIPAIKGSGKELIGGEAEELTDEEKALPLAKQEKILEKRRKERKKQKK